LKGDVKEKGNVRKIEKGMWKRKKIIDRLKMHVKEKENE
jgi:hypothetical protein